MCRIQRAKSPQKDILYDASDLQYFSDKQPHNPNENSNNDDAGNKEEEEEEEEEEGDKGKASNDTTCVEKYCANDSSNTTTEDFDNKKKGIFFGLFSMSKPDDESSSKDNDNISSAEKEEDATEMDKNNTPKQDTVSKEISDVPKSGLFGNLIGGSKANSVNRGTTPLFESIDNGTVSQRRIPQQTKQTRKLVMIVTPTMTYRSQQETQSKISEAAFSPCFWIPQATAVNQARRIRSKTRCHRPKMLCHLLQRMDPW